MKKRNAAGIITAQGSRKANGVVNAVVIHPPDLSLYLKLQNILNYFVECMNSLTASLHDVPHAEHLSICIGHLETIYNEKPELLNSEICRVLKEFLEEAHKFESIFRVFLSVDCQQNHTDQPSDILLIAKASHLQWLAVCILEELKKELFQN